MELSVITFRASAIRTAQKAGLFLKSRFGRVNRIRYKGVVNLVTEMDLRSEQIIVSEIRRDFPDHSILAEEQSTDQVDSPYCWIIDPLDGTTNYAHSYPVF